MIRLWEIVALAMIIIITMIHAVHFANNKPTGPLFHAVWAAVYFVPFAVIALLYGSWQLGAAFLIERFFFYNPILNAWRGEYIFYLSVAEKHASWWDRIEMAWSAVYRWVWYASGVGLIAIQFFI